MSTEETIPAYYYYIDPLATPYPEPQPNPMENLIDMYGLNDISQQVARYNADGSRGVKLRKSYKNQVSDIAGHWTTENIPTKAKYGDLASKIFHMNHGSNSERESRSNMDADTQMYDSMDWDSYAHVIQSFDNANIMNYISSSPGNGAMNNGSNGAPLQQQQQQQQQHFSVEDLAFDLDGTASTGGKRKRKFANLQQQQQQQQQEQQQQQQQQGVQQQGVATSASSSGMNTPLDAKRRRLE